MKEGLWKFSEYCVVGESSEERLSAFERLTLTGGAELERALQWVARRFVNFHQTQRIGDIDIDAIRRAADFYAGSRFDARPEDFFLPLSKAPIDYSANLLHGLGDGDIYDLEFASQYRAQYPGYAKTYEGFSENRRVFARYWKHREPARATMIAIHGWTMGDQRLNSLAFLPGVFYRMGLDVVLFELPFHGRRRPSGNAMSGELFPSTDMIRTNEAMAQSISDLRALRNVLEQEGSTNFGCIGMSLGAYVGALWSGLDPLQFSIQFVPMVSMSDAAWRLLASRPDIEQLKIDGLSEELLWEVYAIHSPLRFPPQIAPERAFIVAGIGDQIVSSRQPRLLWEHWGEPRFQLFPGGHGAHLKRSVVFEEVQSFLLELGLAKRRVPLNM